jgi:hypothetical protein
MNVATRLLLENINNMPDEDPMPIDRLRHLLESGADPNVRSRISGNTFLQKICVHAYSIGIEDGDISEYMDLFFNHPNIDLNLLNAEGVGLIHILSFDDHYHLLSHFLVNARNKYNVNLRVNKTEDTDYDVTDGATALFIACTHMAKDDAGISSFWGLTKVQSLLRFGADPNALDENGENALIYMLHYSDRLFPHKHVKFCSSDIVELLLKNNTNPNTISNIDGGVSALIEAARFNADGNICHNLLKYGADPRQCMPDGSTVFDDKYPKRLFGMREELLEWLRLRNINWNLTENKSENLMKTSKLHIRLPLDVRERIGSYVFRKPLPTVRPEV